MHDEDESVVNRDDDQRHDATYQNKEPQGCLQHYFNDLRMLPRLSVSEELHYARGACKGDLTCRNAMVQGNLRLVVRIAMSYRAKGTALEDLIAEGNLGLIHAVGKFEPERGFRFSTYATHWIRHYIEQALMLNNRLVKVPVHLVKQLRVVLAAERSLPLLKERPGSVREIANMTGYTEVQVDKLLAIHAISIESLDHPIHEGQDFSLMDCLPSEDGDSVYRLFEWQNLTMLLQSLIANMEPSHKDILARRFGLFGHDASTLDEIAHAIGMARETIRQAIKTSLRKLRIQLENEGFSPQPL